MRASPARRDDGKPPQAALGARPAPDRMLLSQGLAQHRAGNLQGAERLYRLVLASAPRHAGCLHLLGLILLQTSRLEQAAETIRAAIAADGSAPSYHLSLGNALVALGRLDEAVPCYLRMLELSPWNPDAHRNLGDVHLTQGHLNEA